MKFIDVMDEANPLFNKLKERPGHTASIENDSKINYEIKRFLILLKKEAISLSPFSQLFLH